MKAVHVAVLALAAILLVVIVQNSDIAVVHLLFWKVSMSMIILIFFVSLTGFTIGYLTHRFLKERKKIKK